MPYGKMKSTKKTKPSKSKPKPKTTKKKSSGY